MRKNKREEERGSAEAGSDVFSGCGGVLERKAGFVAEQAAE